MAARINRRSRVWALVGLMIISTVTMAQDFDEAAIEREVADLWQRYISAFSAGNAEYIADQVYAAPMYQLGAQGPELRGDREAVYASFAETARNLAARDYARSDSREVNVCVLNDSAALLSIVFTRIDTAGNEMLTGGATYLAARYPEGWRLLAQMGHGVDKVLRCN